MFSASASVPRMAMVVVALLGCAIFLAPAPSGKEKGRGSMPRPSRGCGPSYLLTGATLAQADVLVVGLAVVERHTDPVVEAAGRSLGAPVVYVVLGRGVPPV